MEGGRGSFGEGAYTRALSTRSQTTHSTLNRSEIKFLRLSPRERRAPRSCTRESKSSIDDPIPRTTFPLTDFRVTAITRVSSAVRLRHGYIAAKCEISASLNRGPQRTAKPYNIVMRCFLRFSARNRRLTASFKSRKSVHASPSLPRSVYQ